MKARRILIGVAAIVALLTIAAGVFAQSIRPQADVGVGVAARVACGCRYIEGRPIGQCPDDFEAGMELIRVSDDPATRTVTASVPLLAHRSARFDPVLGCQPEPFRGTAFEVH